MMRLSLNPLKPPTTAAAAASLRRFSADPNPTPAPDAPCPISEAVTLLQSSDPISWPTNPKLRDLLSAASPPSVLKITRQLPHSQNALDFLEFIKTNPHLSDSAPFAFQAILELTMRENPKAGEKLYELFSMAKEENIPISVNAGTLLIKCFSRANMMGEMLTVFESMNVKVKNTHVMNLVLTGMFAMRRFDDAMKLLDEMLQPDAPYPVDKNTMSAAFSAILGKNSRSKKVSDAEICKLHSRFDERGIRLDGFWLSQLIARFCANDELEKAWSVFSEGMKSGSTVEVRSCNALLTKLGRKHDYARMNLLMKEMKAKGIQPTVVTYGIMIKNLSRIRRLDEALEVLEKMIDGEAGVEPDVIIYNSLIDGLCRVGRHEEGLKLMEKMRLAESKCKPNTVTYNCLIDGFCKAGDIDKGIKLFEEMSDHGVAMNVITLNTMLGGMCRHGRVSSAVDLFSSMREKKGLKGNVVTYTVLITAFCSANNVDRGMKLFEEMKENGCTPDAVVYYTLISGFTQAGRMGDATLILSEMKEAGFSLDIVGYNIMIGGFCRTKKMDKAVEMLNDMEKDGLKPDRVTYNTLLTYFCDKGDFKHAHKVLRNMLDDGLTPTVVTYGTLIQGYCTKHNLAAAMGIFSDMKSTSKVPPNTVIYNILIDAHCKKDDVEGALSLMEEMKDQKVKANTTTYNALFKGLQRRNWREEALMFMNRMIEDKCLPDYVTMEILTEWLSGVGETEKLKEFVEACQVSDSTQ